MMSCGWAPRGSHHPSVSALLTARPRGFVSWRRTQWVHHGPHRASKAYKLGSVHPEGPCSALPSTPSPPRGCPWRRPCCPRSWVCPVQKLDPATGRRAATVPVAEPGRPQRRKDINKPSVKSKFAVSCTPNTNPTGRHFSGCAFFMVWR